MENPADEKFWFIEIEDGSLSLKVADDSAAPEPNRIIERNGATVIQVTVDGNKLMEELGGE